MNDRIVIDVINSVKGPRYYVRHGAKTLNILNANSLTFFLKHQLGMKKKEITAVLTATTTQEIVIIERVAA